MGFLAAGLVVAAVGAGVSAYGTAKNAESQQDAANAAAASQEGLFLRQDENLRKLIKQKENKLYDQGNIFERFKSTGAFGDTTTLENLRIAQQDFSNLAAGDFSGFEAQLKKTIGDALVNTGQSGAPIGAFAGLAADQQMQFRKEGINTAVGITDFLSAQTQQLLGAEFGIMDQKFNTGYQLDRDRVLGVNSSLQQAAAQEGVGTVAYGNAGQSIGSTMMTYGMYQGSQQRQAQRPQYAQASNGSMMQVPRYSSPPSAYQQFARPVSNSVSSYAPTSPMLPVASYGEHEILPTGAIPENGSFVEVFDPALGVLPSLTPIQQTMQQPQQSMLMSAFNGYRTAGAAGALFSVGANIVANLGK